MVIRISAALAAIGGNAEAELDNRVHGILKDLFPWIYENGHLKNMLKDQWHTIKDAIYEIENDFPEKVKFSKKLNWVLDFINKFRDKQKDSLYHDFNRVIINYLTKRYDLKLILILDNLDQTPEKYQEEIFMLCRHKQDWINIKDKFIFIIGIRSYMLDVVDRESIVQAYSADGNLKGVKIFPPAIENVLINRLDYFTRKIKSTSKIEIGEKFIILPKEDILKELRRFFNIFSNPSNEIVLSKLANYNVRNQLELVEAIFKSWKFDIIDVFQFANENEREFFYSQYEIIRAILMQDNYIVKPPPNQFFLNIFGMGDGEHFSCILNGYYVLKLLSGNTQKVDNIIDTLFDFGHYKELTLNTIQSFLKKNIIGSPEGIDLKKHNIETISISSKYTTTGKVYLNDLTFQLIYLEAMTYLTMLDQDLIEILPIPTSNRPLSFKSLVKSALILIKQIERAENAQLDYLKLIDKVDKFYQLGLNGFASKIDSRINLTITKLNKDGFFTDIDITNIKEDIKNTSL